MKLVKATLVSREVKSGRGFVRDEVPLGKEYMVDIDSLSTKSWLCAECGNIHDTDAVMIYEDGSERGWMPAELLKIEETIH